EPGLFIGTYRTWIVRIRIGEKARCATLQPLIGESTNEGRTMASLDHVGFAYEEIYATRPFRVHPEAGIPGGQVIALKIPEGSSAISSARRTMVSASLSESISARAAASA